MPKQKVNIKNMVNTPFSHVLIIKRNLDNSKPLDTQTIFYHNPKNAVEFTERILEIDYTLESIDLCRIEKTWLGKGMTLKLLEKSMETFQHQQDKP
jgi:hypothetical protein